MAQPITSLESISLTRPWIAKDSVCISEMPGGIVVQNTNPIGEMITAKKMILKKDVGLEKWDFRYSRYLQSRKDISSVDQISKRPVS